MSSKQSDTKQSETLTIKMTAPTKLIQSKNYNECDFLMSMLSEQCTLGAGFAIKRAVTEPVKVKQSCEDILVILERCILDGHDCKSNLYKFNVLCKEDIDTKIE